MVVLWGAAVSGGRGTPVNPEGASRRARHGRWAGPLSAWCRAVEPEQWFQRHPEAGPSWPSWPRSACPLLRDDAVASGRGQGYDTHTLSLVECTRVCVVHACVCVCGACRARVCVCVCSKRVCVCVCLWCTHGLLGICFVHWLKKGLSCRGERR